MESMASKSHTSDAVLSGTDFKVNVKPASNVHVQGGNSASHLPIQHTSSGRAVKFSTRHVRKPGPHYSSPNQAPDSDITSSPGTVVSSLLSPRPSVYLGSFTSPSEKLLRAAQNYAVSDHAREQPQASPDPEPEPYPGVMPRQLRRQMETHDMLAPVRLQLAMQCATSEAALHGPSPSIPSIYSPLPISTNSLYSMPRAAASPTVVPQPRPDSYSTGNQHPLGLSVPLRQQPATMNPAPMYDPQYGPAQQYALAPAPRHSAVTAHQPGPARTSNAHTTRPVLSATTVSALARSVSTPGQAVVKTASRVPQQPSSSARMPPVKEQPLCAGQYTSPHTNMGPSVEAADCQEATFEAVHVMLSSIPLLSANALNDARVRSEFTSTPPKPPASPGPWSVGGACQPTPSVQPSTARRQLLPSPSKALPQILQQSAWQDSETGASVAVSLADLRTAVSTTAAAGLVSARVGQGLAATSSAKQQAALQQALSTELTLPQAFAVLDLGYAGSQSSLSASMLSSLGRDPRDDCESHLQLPASLSYLSFRMLRLKSIVAVARAKRELMRQEWRAAGQKLHDIEVELNMAKAREMATKMGFSRAQLKRLQPQAGGASFNTALLTAVSKKLRCKLAVLVMEHQAAWAKELPLLLQQADQALPVAQLVALLRAWRQVAARKASDKQLVRQHRRARLIHGARRALAMWHVVTCYRQEQRVALQAATAGRCSRILRRCMHWWRSWAQYSAWREQTVVRAHSHRASLWLLSWQRAAVAQAERRQRAILAVAMHLRRIMSAALAHWRFQHLRKYMKSVWLRAVDAWYVLQLKGRVLQKWHFLARRATAVIARAGAATGGARGGVHVPPPLALQGSAATGQQVLSTASFLLEAAADEVNYLRTFCRFRMESPALQAFRRMPVWKQILLGSAAPLLEKAEVIDGREGEKAPLQASRWAREVSQDDEEEGPGVLATLLKAAALPSPGQPRIKAMLAGVSSTLAAQTAASHECQSDTSRPAVTFSEAAAQAAAAGEAAATCDAPGGNPMLLNQWQFKHEVSYLLRALKFAEEEHHETKTQLAQSQAHADEAKASIQAILAVHNTKLSERRSPLAQLQAERAQLSNELQALSKEVEGLGQSLATSQAALTQTLGTSVEIQEQLGKHSGSLAGNAAELGAQHRAACEAVDMARARVGEAEVAVAAAEDAERAGREALLAAQARLSEALQICGALSNHVRQAQANACNAAPMHAERTTRAVANAQAQLGEAQHVVAIAQAEVGRIEDLVRSHTAAVSTAQQSLDAWRSELTRCTQVASGTAQAANLASERANAATTSASALSATLQALADQKNTLENEVVGLQRRLKPLQDQLASKRRQQAELATRVLGMQAEVQDLEALMAQASQETEEVDALMQSRKLQLQPIAARAAAQVSQLRHQLAEYPPALVVAVGKLLDEEAAQQASRGNSHEGAASGMAARCRGDPGVLLIPQQIPLGPQGVLPFPTAAAAIPTSQGSAPCATPPIRFNPTGAAGLPLHLLRLPKSVREEQLQQLLAASRRKASPKKMDKGGDDSAHKGTTKPGGDHKRVLSPVSGGVAKRAWCRRSPPPPGCAGPWSPRQPWIPPGIAEIRPASPPRPGYVPSPDQAGSPTRSRAATLAALSTAQRDVERVSTIAAAARAAAQAAADCGLSSPTTSRATALPGEGQPGWLGSRLAALDIAAARAGHPSFLTLSELSSAYSDTSYSPSVAQKLPGVTHTSTHTSGNAGANLPPGTWQIQPPPSPTAAYPTTTTITRNGVGVSRAVPFSSDTDGLARVQGNGAGHMASASASFSFAKQPVDQAAAGQPLRRKGSGKGPLGDPRGTSASAQTPPPQQFLNARAPTVKGDAGPDYQGGVAAPQCVVQHASDPGSLSGPGRCVKSQQTAGAHLSRHPLSGVATLHSTHSAPEPGSQRLKCHRLMAAGWETDDSASSTSENASDGASNHERTGAVFPSDQDTCAQHSLQEPAPTQAPGPACVNTRSMSYAALLHHHRQVLARSIKGWRRATRAATTRALAATHRGAVACQRWALNTWRTNFRAVHGEAAQLGRHARLRRFLLTWSHLTARRSRNWAVVAAAAEARRTHTLRCVLSALHMRVVRKAYFFACCQAIANRKARAALQYWRGLVEARALIYRVFTTAAEMWERDMSVVYGDEFKLIHQALWRWVEFAEAKRDKRALRALEATADAHWRTRTAVRCFTALREAVGAKWEQWRLVRSAKRMVRAWQDLAEEGSIHQFREWLRMKRGVYSEAGIYTQKLLLRALVAWAGAKLWTPVHCEHTMLVKALTGWRKISSHRQEAAEQHWLRLQPQRALHALRLWRQVSATKKQLRQGFNLAAVWHTHWVLRSCMVGWRQLMQERLEAHRAIAIAVVHRVATLRRHTLRALQAAVAHRKQAQADAVAEVTRIAAAMAAEAEAGVAAAAEAEAGAAAAEAAAASAPAAEAPCHCLKAVQPEPQPQAPCADHTSSVSSVYPSLPAAVAAAIGMTVRSQPHPTFHPPVPPAPASVVSLAQLSAITSARSEPQGDPPGWHESGKIGPNNGQVCSSGLADAQQAPLPPSTTHPSSLPPHTQDATIDHAAWADSFEGVSKVHCVLQPAVTPAPAEPPQAAIMDLAQPVAPGSTDAAEAQAAHAVADHQEQQTAADAAEGTPDRKGSASEQQQEAAKEALCIEWRRLWVMRDALQGWRWVVREGLGDGDHRAWQQAADRTNKREAAGGADEGCAAEAEEAGAEVADGAEAGRQQSQQKQPSTGLMGHLWAADNEPRTPRQNTRRGRKGSRARSGKKKAARKQSDKGAVCSTEQGVLQHVAPCVAKVRGGRTPDRLRGVCKARRSPLQHAAQGGLRGVAEAQQSRAYHHRALQHRQGAAGLQQRLKAMAQTRQPLLDPVRPGQDCQRTSRGAAGRVALPGARSPIRQAEGKMGRVRLAAGSRIGCAGDRAKAGMGGGGAQRASMGVGGHGLPVVRGLFQGPAPSVPTYTGLGCSNLGLSTVVSPPCCHLNTPHSQAPCGVGIADPPAVTEPGREGVEELAARLFPGAQPARKLEQCGVGGRSDSTGRGASVSQGHSLAGPDPGSQEWHELRAFIRQPISFMAALNEAPPSFSQSQAWQQQQQQPVQQAEQQHAHPRGTLVEEGQENGFEARRGQSVGVDGTGVDGGGAHGVVAGAGATAVGVASQRLPCRTTPVPRSWNVSGVVVHPGCQGASSNAMCQAVNTEEGVLCSTSTVPRGCHQALQPTDGNQRVVSAHADHRHQPPLPGRLGGAQTASFSFRVPSTVRSSSVGVVRESAAAGAAHVVKPLLMSVTGGLPGRCWVEG